MSGFLKVSRDFGGRDIILETGKLAKQADGSIYCRYGDSAVLCAVVSAKEAKPGQDFFPLTVDFQEKFYAAGRIPGGFFKREAKPPDMAILTARLTDRPIRPLFPEDYLHDTNVTITVLSHDGVNDPGIMGQIATSAALHISDIPFNGPIGSARVGFIDGEFVLNFNPEDAEKSEIDLLVSGVRGGIVMVEGLAKEASEQQMVDALEFAHQSMMPILDLQEEMREKLGRPKRDYTKPPQDESLKNSMREMLKPQLEKAFSVRDKLERYKALDEVKKGAKEEFTVKDPQTEEDQIRNSLIGSYFGDLKAEFARNLTLDTNKRIDGRAYNDIRNISCETGLLPRTHGSAVFTRGETQVLSTVTLGTKDDEQRIDSIGGQFQKSFLLHYNFPPFSVGEARPLRPPGRREIGHGVLAERALQFVIPDKETFPYTIRLVAEVLESNGSSSMATVCSGSMAMMDAGVPLPKPVAGVAMGLIKEGEKMAILSDILGDEDHLGDMDFKVCGTSEGITAFQMDLKIEGITRDIMEKALNQAKEGRLHILEEMAKSISGPREGLSAYAPRIFTIKVKPEKVREVIGSGGKVIRGIIEATGVKMDIEDDGTIHIASSDEEAANKAINMVNAIVEEAEPGKVYEGKVVRLADFGAFIEIMPGTDGLCHISELAHERVGQVSDVLSEGDVLKVKCLEVDASGKIRLSRKALIPREDGSYTTDEDHGIGRDRGDRGGRGGDRGGRGGDRGGRGGDRGGRGGDRGGRGGDRGGRGGFREGRGRDDRGGNRDTRGREDRGPRDRDDRGPRDREDRGPRDRDDRGGRDRDDHRGTRDREDRGGRGRGGRDRDDRGGNRDTRGRGEDRGNRGGGRDRDDRGGRGRDDDRGNRGPRDDDRGNRNPDWDRDRD